MSTHDADVLIIGAGLAGLQCARTLHGAGQRVLVLDAAEAVGGRVRTDEVDGFLLDRGFQVLLDSYPMARANLDFDALNLRPFVSGALVWHNNAFHKISDPWRQPDQLFKTLCVPLGSFGDKVKIASLRSSVTRPSIEELFTRPETTTERALQKRGFSARFIDGFFRPFLGGVSLDFHLETSSRFFEFVFKMFSEGKTVVPEKGMQQIPNQLASTLSADSIRLCSRVLQMDVNSATLESGETFSAPYIVLATEGDSAAHLLGEANTPNPQPPLHWRSTTCLYFAADRSPVNSPALVLNGSGEGPINNLVVISDVAPEYSSSGEALISVSVLGDPPVSDEQVVADVRQELQQWYGEKAKAWRFLRLYRMRKSLPILPTIPASPQRTSRHHNIQVCGDFQAHPSIQGAMESGEKAAVAILAEA